MAHRRSDTGRSLLWIPGCVCMAVLWCGVVARAEYGEPGLSIPHAADTLLKVAYSQDGRSFTETGQVFVSRAAAPALATLRGGTIVAVFDYAGESDSNASTVLAASVSRSGGGSWSAARTVRLAGRRARDITARHATLVRASDRYLRLYFVAEINGRHSHRAFTRVLSAVSLRGLDYRLDPQTRVRDGGFADPHPVAALLDGKTHLYIAGPQARGSTERATVEHFISRKGRRFARLRPSRTPEIDVIGSVVPVDGGFRAYVSTGDGIMSLLSRDGRDWEAEDGLILSAAWDPAVVRLSNGSYLMIYCASADRESLASPQLVEVSLEQLCENTDPLDLVDAIEGSHQQASSAELDDQNAHDVAIGDQDSIEESVIVAPGEDHAGAGTEAGCGDESADGTSSADVADASDAEEDGDPVDRLSEMDSAEEAELLEDLLRPVESEPIIGADEGGFALRPDFKNKVDYLEWYRRYALPHPEDNASDAYASFFPDPSDEMENDPNWPKFNDMFNSDYDGPIAPWSPADHPEWEEAYHRTAEVREKFAEAATHTGYASPPQTGGDDLESLPDSSELLIGMLLPSLSPHRTMVRATLAAAWREKEGKVPPEQMLEAWRTSYRAASHMFQGATLIEGLVGTAEAAQAQKNARMALNHGVFSGDELQKAFDTLREYDRDHWDPGVALRGEHGMSMQMTQWMFSPPTPEGLPKLNKERAEAFAGMEWFEDHVGGDFAEMGSDDAYATIDAVDAHYRELSEQMQIGYPDVRAADINATTEEYRSASPLTRELFPSLGRVHTLATRLKASRRATQLAYATHLFKEKNGRWPASLDELPADWGRSMRIDPFTGGDFGYRVTEDGPRIYSKSENGVDDGGVHSPRWEDKVDPETGSDDHVFWPPQPN